MKLMLDSNIFISAIIFQSNQMNEFVKKIKSHTLHLTNIILDEVIAVINRKFPSKLNIFEQFLSELSFEYSYVPTDVIYEYDIRDEFDKKILHSAYHCEVDILITGDKDFFEKQYEGLKIMTVTDFLNQ